MNIIIIDFALFKNLETILSSQINYNSIKMGFLVEETTNIQLSLIQQSYAEDRKKS